MTRSRYNLPRDDGPNSMRDEHRDDDSSRNDRPISANVLQIYWNVKKVRPIDKALESSVRQD